MPTIPPPPTPRRYGPLPQIGLVAAAGGYLITCACRWLKWFETEKAARDGEREHEKKCKAVGE